MLEDGRLTDSKGRVVDFKNCIIIMTSNIGSKVIERASTGSSNLGFTLNNTTDSHYLRLKNIVLEELKNFFRYILLYI